MTQVLGRADQRLWHWADAYGHGPISSRKGLELSDGSVLTDGDELDCSSSDPFDRLASRDQRNGRDRIVPAD